MLRLLYRYFLLVLVLWHASTASAQNPRPEPSIRYWIDAHGTASAAQVAALAPAELKALQQSSFTLPTGALWLSIDLPTMPVLPGNAPHVLTLASSAFTDRASLYQQQGGEWVGQHAGDHLPVSLWTHPDRAPAFVLDSTRGPRTVLMRLENHPAPLSVRLELLPMSELQASRAWTLLLVGGYLGFGLLVLFIGAMHAWLYRDRAFLAYLAYVGSMLGFQAAFTGIGGLFIWPQSAAWNDAAPPLFMLWLTGAGIWFVREVCRLQRHSLRLDRTVLAWSAFGLLYPALYLAWHDATAYALLNLYGLLSVLLSIGLCLWAWRRGERYAGWIALGFLPVHLAYPFPALRAAGLVPDGWAAQYAVLIGSAIEIPLLLFILHRRAKRSSESRARLRALDSQDPLTGLTVSPVLNLRLRDAIRRGRRYDHLCGLLLVELSNHADLRMRLGREAADRALVVAAARLSRVVRDVDTVCRVTDTRFAILVEGPQRFEQMRLLAQHIVAKGLEPGSLLPDDTRLRFRLVTTMLPGDRAVAAEEDERVEARRTLDRLHQALEDQGDDPRRPVLHLPREATTQPAST